MQEWLYHAIFGGVQGFGQNCEESMFLVMILKKFKIFWGPPKSILGFMFPSLVPKNYFGQNCDFRHLLNVIISMLMLSTPAHIKIGLES